MFSPTSTDACSAGGDRLMPVAQADDLASVFKALGDPTRVRLLHYLAAADEGTVCACHLPDALGISQPTLSHHLKKLTAAGLVTREQRGRWAHWTIVPERLSQARDFLGLPGSDDRCR